MKAKCATLGMLMGVNNVMKAISTKVALPILTHILLQAKEGRLIFSATDLEFGIQCDIPAEVEIEGGVAIPARVFSELVNQIDAEFIQMELKDSTFEVKTENSVYQFAIRSEDEYPIMAKFDPNAKGKVSIKQSILKNMIKKVSFCTAGNEEPRMVLTGVNISIDDQGILMVATDTRRLGVMTEKLENTPAKEINFIVPGRAINEISKLLVGDDDVDLYLSEGQLFLSFGSMNIFSRIIEGKYPDYEQVIPRSHDTIITIEKDGLQKSTRRALIMAQEKDSPFFLGLEVKNGKVILTTDTADLGKAREEIMAEVEGDDASVSFNGKFFLDAITNIESQKMKLSLTNKTNPGLVNDVENDKYFYIVMPLRFKGQEEVEEELCEEGVDDEFPY